MTTEQKPEQRPFSLEGALQIDVMTLRFFAAMVLVGVGAAALWNWFLAPLGCGLVSTDGMVIPCVLVALVLVFAFDKDRLQEISLEGPGRCARVLAIGWAVHFIFF